MASAYEHQMRPTRPLPDPDTPELFRWNVAERCWRCGLCNKPGTYDKLVSERCVCDVSSVVCVRVLCHVCMVCVCVCVCVCDCVSGVVGYVWCFACGTLCAVCSVCVCERESVCCVCIPVSVCVSVSVSVSVSVGVSVSVSVSVCECECVFECVCESVSVCVCV